MGTAVLNLSLDDKVGPGPVWQRHRAVMAALRLCFQDVVGEIQSVTYTDPDGKTVHESCSVVTIGFECSRALLESVLHQISRQMGQDCIALLYSTGEGECIGPEAARWPFDRSKFSLPSICALYQEAA